MDGNQLLVGQVDVVLVNPPMFDLHRPSISLGVLQAILDDMNVSSKVLYANLWYSEHIGAANYAYANAFPSHSGAGDWIFTKELSSSSAASEKEYVKSISQLEGVSELHERLSSTDIVDSLRILRQSAGAFIDEVATRILSLRPKIVGCTSTFVQHGASLAILNAVKKRAPDVYTIIGGANCESIMGLTLHRSRKDIDFVFSGEAEESFPTVVNACLGLSEITPETLRCYGVFGPADRQESYERINALDRIPRTSTQRMDDVPTPSYRDYFDALHGYKFSRHMVVGLPMETSRGCWWGQISHCKFCGLNGSNMDYRVKDEEIAFSEFKYLTSKWNVRRIEYVDNILHQKYFGSFLDSLIESKETNFHAIFFETKSNLKRDQVEKLAEAGVRHIQPGIESLDSRVLALMGKGVKCWQNVRLLKWTRQYGVSCAWATIYGFPMEDDDWYGEASKIVPLIRHMQPGGLNRLRFDRFSPYFQDQSDYGLRLRAQAHLKHVYPLEPGEVEDFVYYFEHTEKEPSSRSGYRKAIVGADGPGLKAYIDAVTDWCTAWSKSPRPICVYYEKDGAFFVKDGRHDPLTAKDHELSTLEARIIELTADGVPVASFVNRLQATIDFETAQLEDALTSLKEAGFLLEQDQYYLSLPNIWPVSRMPDPKQNPFGFLMLNEQTEATGTELLVKENLV